MTGIIISIICTWSLGTEFSGYADGVYVSNNPLEGFSYQKHNPFSL